MTRDTQATDEISPRASGWPHGGGITGALVRDLDWSRTPLGPVEAWPENLRTTVTNLLHSRHPVLVFWGPELIQVYNDAHLPILGDKHPEAMGQRGSACWSEAWPLVSPQIDDVMQRAKACWSEDQLIPILRNGRIEEAYFSYSYSPIFNDRGGVDGTLVVATDTTRRVLVDRRLRRLQALTERLVLAGEPATVLQRAADALQSADKDVPFAVMSLLDARTGEARLHESVGLGSSPVPPALVSLAKEAMVEGKALHIADRDGSQGLRIQAGPWPEAVSEVFIGPIRVAGEEKATGFIAFGISPRAAFDEAYREHLVQMTTQIENALSLQTAVAARDAFLALASHELRTPLASMKLQIQLYQRRLEKSPEAVLAPEALEKLLATTGRHTDRLTRLVDDMLDISRIAAGKLSMTPEHGSLSALVRETVERSSPELAAAGSELTMSIDPDIEGAWDRYRIEQVITNLLTNVVHYAPGAPVQVSLRREGERVVLAVRDQGPGIAQESLEKVFERFERLKSSNERGLGLGLYICREIVEAHGGTIRAESQLGKGTSFLVELPAGTRG